MRRGEHPGLARACAGDDQGRADGGAGPPRPAPGSALRAAPRVGREQARRRATSPPTLPAPSDTLGRLGSGPRPARGPPDAPPRPLRGPDPRPRTPSGQPCGPAPGTVCDVRAGTIEVVSTPCRRARGQRAAGGGRRSGAGDGAGARPGVQLPGPAAAGGARRALDAPSGVKPGGSCWPWASRWGLSRPDAASMRVTLPRARPRRARPRGRRPRRTAGEVAASRPMASSRAHPRGASRSWARSRCCASSSRPSR